MKENGKQGKTWIIFSSQAEPVTQVVEYGTQNLLDPGSNLIVCLDSFIWNSVDLDPYQTLKWMLMAIIIQA